MYDATGVRLHAGRQAEVRLLIRMKTLLFVNGLLKSMAYVENFKSACLYT